MARCLRRRARLVELGSKTGECVSGVRSMVTDGATDTGGVHMKSFLFVRRISALTLIVTLCQMRSTVLIASVLACMPAVVLGQDLALENARIVDPARGEITEGSMLVRDGEVVSVESALPTDFDGERIDVEGRWVIPGLVDMHTHSTGNGSPAGMPQMLGYETTSRLALYAGVVAFLDLFSDEDAIFAFRDAQRAGGTTGAAVFAAGPCLTATYGHCTQFGVQTRVVNSPADAAREVDALAAKRPDVVKVVYDTSSFPGMPTIDRETLNAVIESARRHDLKTVVHVGTWDDVRHAVLAGATAVTHTPGPDPLPPDLPQLMVEHGTAHIPTLAVESDLAKIADDLSMLDNPLLAGVTTEALRDAYGSLANGASAAQGWVGRFLTLQRSVSDVIQGAVRTLADAGVPMLTGTDAGNVGVFQGFSVHRELELFVDAGLSEWEALRAATTNAAAFLGERWGVAPGDEATFVILDGSPIEDISNTQRIHAVVQRGVVVNREELRLR